METDSLSTDVQVSLATDKHAISSGYYTIDDLRFLLEHRPKLSLSGTVVKKICDGADFVLKKAAEDRYIYGVNTGFGSLCETRVENDEMEALQYNHVLSHAAGVGPIVAEEHSRLCLLVKLLTFRSGNTGISLDVVERFVEFWNHDAIPTIPKKGSVGASGDLAPLAHMGLPLLGLGSMYFRGEVVPAADALEAMGMEPLTLKPKEGLAITNGVQYINSAAAWALMDIGELVLTADVVASLSSQGFSTSRTFYQELYQKTSHHPERHVVARNMMKLLDGSNHYQLPTCNKSMQDPYSFRCTPQVHAAVRQAYQHSKTLIERECNSVSDNPLFFPGEDTILFGGALHGETTAITLDYLGIAVSELASISERRTYQLLSGQRGLPDFLVPNHGVNSGLMIAQYTSAALVNENKVLSSPASVDTIATCQLQEDHVSMGPTAAYKLETIRENCAHILAIELLHAAQAIDMNDGLVLSPTTREIYDAFRAEISFMEGDRIVADDIAAALDFYRRHKRTWATTLGLE
jgi:histidine ammonia-lyase